MRFIRAFILAILIIVVAMIWYGATLIRHGFSATSQPSAFETFVASSARQAAIPDDAKQLKDPLPNTPDNVIAGRSHFADHCATCHANDGSGRTEMGPNFYPKVPDLRLKETQSKTDGELFYIIKNGIALSGMPAWGPIHEDADNWKLVMFIRHLPQLAPEEEKEMEKFNPKSQDDDDAAPAGGPAQGK